MKWPGSALGFGFIVFVSAVAQSTTTVWTGVYVTEQATRGGELYKTTCAECHGDDLEGRETAPALAGLAFRQRWDGATLKKLFESMEQMPPDDPAARLEPKKLVDVLAFLLNVNGIPAGTKTLVADKDALAAITFTSRKAER